MLKTSQMFEEHLGAEDKAVGVLEGLLELDSHNAEALDRLERLYRGQSNPEGLVRVLRLKVDSIDDMLEQKEQLYHVRQRNQKCLPRPPAAPPPPPSTLPTTTTTRCARPPS